MSIWKPSDLLSVPEGRQDLQALQQDLERHGQGFHNEEVPRQQAAEQGVQRQHPELPEDHRQLQAGLDHHRRPQVIKRVRGRVPAPSRKSVLFPSDIVDVFL